MRYCFPVLFLTLILLVGPSRGDEPPTNVKPSTATAAESATGTTSASPSKAVASSQPVTPKRPVSLHRHPTLTRMLARNNQWRTAAGLAPQRLHPALTRAAQDHANYMARTGSFSHHSNGGPLARAARYGFQGLVRENLAMGQVTISEAFQSWRNSGGHWANVCCDAPAAGFGYAIDAAGNGYWVGVYGYPTSQDDQREQAELTAEKADEQPATKNERPKKPDAAKSDSSQTEAAEQPAATNQTKPPSSGDLNSSQGGQNSPPTNQTEAPTTSPVAPSPDPASATSSTTQNQSETVP